MSMKTSRPCKLSSLTSNIMMRTRYCPLPVYDHETPRDMEPLLTFTINLLMDNRVSNGILFFLN